MGWADKRWHEKVRAKRGSADLNKTSGTQSEERTESMPVVIERQHQRLLKGPPPGAPYVDIIAAWRAPMAPDTWAAYSKDLELWARAMGATLEDLAELCIRSPADAYKTAILRRAGEIAQDQGLATSTRLRKLASLRSWVNHIADYREDGYVPKIRRPKYRGQAKARVQVRGEYVSRDLERVIRELEGADTMKAKRDLAMVLLMFDSGLRVGSVTSLRLSDVKSDSVCVKMKMRGGAREARPISARARQALEDWISCRGDGGVWVFSPIRSAERGEFPQLTTRGAWRVINRLGLDHPHKLRHAAATALADETGDVFLVRDFLGHSDVSTSSGYVDRSEQNARRGTEILSRKKRR